MADFLVKAPRLTFDLTDTKVPNARFDWRNFRRGHKFEGGKPDELPKEQWDRFVEKGYIVKDPASESNAADSKSGPVEAPKK